MAETQSAEKKLASGKEVVYVGTANVREITNADWSSVGSKTGKTVWSKDNWHSVNEADFDDVALEYISHDPEFVIRDVNPKK